MKGMKDKNTIFYIIKFCCTLKIIVIKFQKKKQDIFSCVRNIIEIYPYDTECIVNRKRNELNV